jgi:hypothetical protein
VSEGAGPTSAARVAWNAGFRHRDFRLFLGARFASVVGIQMQSVAIGWQVYSITGRPMSLAWVGLAQFFPVAGLSLLAGQVADRFPRRKILMVCQGAMAALSAALFLLARAGVTHVAPICAVLVGIGVGGDHRLRCLAELRRVAGHADRAGRVGHGEGVRSLRAGAAGDSGRDTRAGQRGEHGLHRRQQRARRVRVGAHGGVAGDRALGGGRGPGHARRRRPVDLGFSSPAPHRSPRRRDATRLA